MKPTGHLQLQVRENENDRWHTLNRAYENGRGEVYKSLERLRAGWQQTCYPVASFRIVRAGAGDDH